MAVQADGKIVAAGEAFTNSNSNFALARYQDSRLPFSDTFTRADAATLGTDYTSQVGTFGVVGNPARANGPVALTTLTDVSLADVTLQANVNVAAGQAAGLVARYGGPGDGNMYWGTLIATGNGQFAAQIWQQRRRHLDAPGCQFTARLGGRPAPLRRRRQRAAAVRRRHPPRVRQRHRPCRCRLAGLRASGNQTFDNVLIDALGLATSTPLSSDSFDRADAATLGGNWTNRVGSTGVAGNAAKATAPVATATLNAVSRADVAVEADVDVAAGQAAGVVARYGGPGDANMYWGTIIATSDGGTQFAAQIWRNVGGTWTRLATVHARLG